jgi:DNA-binding protein WhiA
MSFTNDVKHELCECEVPENSKEALRYGIFYGFRGDIPYFLTYDRKTAYYIKRVIPKKYIKLTETSLKNKTGYCVNVNSMEILSEYGYFRNDIDISKIGGSDENVGLFLRGVFLTSGNVYVQKAGYHLEFSLYDDERCRSLYRLINEQGMKIELSHRGRHSFLYSKDSENISDILTFIGAMQSAMEIMNIKIIKEVRSNINRSVNCETANIERTVKASAKQIEDIELIFDVIGQDKLGEDLREIALLRLNNPDMSLRDLGLLAEPHISRSGVNHRFERIAKIAAELRNDSGE